MDRPWLVAVFFIIAAVAATTVYLAQLGRGGWVSVPRRVHAFDQFPGEEVIIRGTLEENDRFVLAIPKSGEPTLVTEAEVDRIASEGLLNEYDFRNPGWTHRIQLNNSEIAPNFVIDGRAYYVIVSSGTEAWRSEDLFDKYVGREVEILGKWHSFTDPVYPELSVTQFQPKSIR